MSELEERVGMELREVSDYPQPEVGAPRVFGEPYETVGGSTIITVARVRNWRGVTSSPVGVFVIHDGTVTWKPAADATRIALLGEFIGLASAVIATLAVLRRPPWPDLSAATIGLLSQAKGRRGSDPVRIRIRCRSRSREP